MIDPSVLKNTLSNPESDWLYSLKALHKASGGLKKHQPSDFLKLQHTENRIRFLESQEKNHRSLIIRSEEGRNGDTYVCRKLVYCYASWISPEFEFMVIDVFDAMLHGETEHAENIIKIYQGHQPNHPNSLPALLNKPRSQCNPDFGWLQQKEIVGMTLQTRKPQAIYHVGINSDGLVIGKHGNTLLFHESIVDVFPKQIAWH